MNVIVYRVAILVALICAAVAIVIPTAPIHVDLALDPATLEETKPVVGMLCLMLLMVALALSAVAAIGLLRFRSWGRRMASWTTAMVVLAMVGALTLLPLWQAMRGLHVALWIAAGAAWALALLLSHGERTRFT
jgi:hypothetical protein